tara:strand:+ start:8779 stop:10434 length:1656 start_codon:yes stop_codon:yes gene_type:complete
MCGIIGYVGQGKKMWNGRTLHHRGPDNIFNYSSTNLNIDFYRLKINGESGEQPFVSSCKEIYVWCNGEIFNYLELSKKYNINVLDCDISVLPDLIKKRGLKKSLNEIRGFFSIVVFNKKTNYLSLAIDHFGIKPLYYEVNKYGMMFGSELKIFSNSNLNELAIKQFLETGSSISPNTLIDEVNSIEPATILTFDIKNEIKKISKSQFWSLKKNTKKKKFNKSLEYYINQAFNRNELSDYPITNLLSGGVDSTLISLIMPNINEHLYFNFGKLKGKDEFLNINILKEKLNIKILDLEKINFLNEFNEYIKSCDEVVFDFAGFIYFKLMQKVSDQKLRVVLNGTGGDELFFGYKRYNHISYVKNLFGFIKNKQPLYNPYDFLKKGFWNSFPSKTKTNIPFNRSDFKSQKEYLRFIDFNYYLPFTLLRYTDRISNYFSIESRVPFLDVDLVEYVFYSKDIDQTVFKKKPLVDLIKKFNSNLKFNFKEGLGLPIDKIISKSDINESILPTILNSKLLNFIPNLNLLSWNLKNRINIWRIMGLYSLVKWHENHERN